MKAKVTQLERLAWSLAEISEATGLSQGFLRNEQRAGRLTVKRFGRRVVVLDRDLESYLSRGSTSDVDDRHNDRGTG